jgi:hypothetical protein
MPYWIAPDFEHGNQVTFGPTELNGSYRANSKTVGFETQVMQGTTHRTMLDKKNKRTMLTSYFVSSQFSYFSFFKYIDA